MQMQMQMHTNNYLTQVSIGIVTSRNNPVVRLCRVPFDTYAANPPDTPLFEDLVDKHCNELNTKMVSLSVVGRLPVLKSPTGFVFHESRSGSTLVSDMLAANPANMVCCCAVGSRHDKVQVYADSQMLAGIVQSSGCSRERRMYVLRTIMNAMGNSAQHTGLYFKFQSVVSLDMDLLLEASTCCHDGC